ncbi:MAG: hypothetical protein ACRDFS_07095 [Chloroflexota bacterium]
MTRLAVAALVLAIVGLAWAVQPFPGHPVRIDHARRLDRPAVPLPTLGG